MCNYGDMDECPSQLEKILLHSLKFVLEARFTDLNFVSQCMQCPKIQHLCTKVLNFLGRGARSHPFGILVMSPQNEILTTSLSDTANVSTYFQAHRLCTLYVFSKVASLTLHVHDRSLELSIVQVLDENKTLRPTF